MVHIAYLSQAFDDAMECRQLWAHNYTNLNKPLKPQTACMPSAVHTQSICQRRSDVLTIVAITLTASMAAC